MKYDFTTLPDRHGRDSIAVDGLGKGFAPDAPQPGFDAIPMWVADMNFVCLPTIQQAVIERVQHPAFGYFDPTPEYYGSIIRWQETRNDVTGLTAEAIGYENGVLGGVISALNCVCSRGDKVLVHSPTYIGFTRCLTDNGYDIVHSPLVQAFCVKGKSLILLSQSAFHLLVIPSKTTHRLNGSIVRKSFPLGIRTRGR